MKTRIFIAFILVTFLALHEARAGIIYGDIAGGNQVFSGYGLGPGGGTNNYIAEGFTMTGTYNLQSVDVILNQFQSQAGSNIALSIFSDNAGVPGADLYDLSTNISIPSSGSPVTFNFTGGGSFLLTSGTKYWLELYATNPQSGTGTTVQWDGEYMPDFSAFATPTGPGATEVGQRRTFSGGTTTSELRTAFQLNGVAVPEPTGIVLAACGLAGLAALGRRRLKEALGR